MSKPLKTRVDSLVYVKGWVKVDHDLNGIPVFVSLPKSGVAPTVASFQASDVTSVTANSDGTWTSYFRILVGPGGTIVPGVGMYDWTIKVTDSPEAPVLKGGQVQVTLT